MEDLVRASPADGLVCGVGTVNRAFFDEERARTLVTAYDYTVFAGPQGLVGHRKLDRMFVLAAQGRLPVVLFAEGGGGRPNDTDTYTVAGLDTPSFLTFAALSGLVPRVGIAFGRCFAGNAVCWAAAMSLSPRMTPVHRHLVGWAARSDGAGQGARGGRGGHLVTVSSEFRRHLPRRRSGSTYSSRTRQDLLDSSLVGGRRHAFPSVHRTSALRLRLRDVSAESGGRARGP